MGQGCKKHGAETGACFLASSSRFCDASLGRSPPKTAAEAVALDRSGRSGFKVASHGVWEICFDPDFQSSNKCEKIRSHFLEDFILFAKALVELRCQRTLKVKLFGATNSALQRSQSPALALPQNPHFHAHKALRLPLHFEVPKHCACHEICTSKFTKCFSCHEV